LTGSDVRGADEAAQAIATLGRDDNHQVRWMVSNYLGQFRGFEQTETLDALSGDIDPWVRGRTAAALISLDASRRASPVVMKILGNLAGDASVDVRIRIARELEKVGGETWAQDVLFRYLTDVPEVSFAAAYTLGGVALGKAVDLFGDAALGDIEAQLWVLRERIARGVVDPSTSRFGPLQAMISRSVDLPAESDRYMRMIDSMSSLISAATDRLLPESPQRRRFFDLMCEDIDESVRWALVLYLATFGTEDLGARHKLEVLAHLGSDPHFWVRREVALALGRWSDDGSVDDRIALLEQMWAAERFSTEACKDEVMHYLADALRSAGATSSASEFNSKH
jgi:HEAT repeat protein